MIALPIQMIRPANPDDSYFGGCHTPLPIPPPNFVPVCPVRSLLPLDPIGNFNKECTVTPFILYAAFTCCRGGLAHRDTGKFPGAPLIKMFFSAPILEFCR